VFNHANFNDPSASLTSSTFGRLTSAQDPRIYELLTEDLGLLLMAAGAAEQKPALRDFRQEDDGVGSR